MEITQLTELELTTRIPKEKLVPAICDFYWDMGHKKIVLTRGSDVDETLEDYDPVKGIENIGQISEISVLTRKQKRKKLGFGSVQINIKGGIFEIKITWGVEMKRRVFHLYAVYVLVSFIVSIYYGWNMCPIDSFWRKYCAALFATAFIFILILPAYYSFNRSIEKINSHPSTERYKTDFEEFIRKKEKELLSERY
ncbi:hypothetical protein [Methanolobus sp. WCC5]|uniref:hypothetical protein n=1 Tax=Methanolobus sp. WCC5 TaxID=3125785 RepID=UPI00324F6A53